jgi:CheY-like chemotaxis protein
MVATLKSIGCEVTATADGTDTVARFEEAQEHEEPFQLLIMDLSIPNGMGGLQAMDRIRHIDPAARAIVSSGYCDDPVLSRYMDYGFRAVLPKPYQPNELKAMVESMLRD